MTIEKALAKGGHFYRDAASARSWSEEDIADRERRSYAIVHAWWLRALHGKGGAPLAVAIAISSYSDNKAGDDREAYPSIDRIIAHTGLSKRSVYSALAELEQAGILTRKRRGPDSSLYTLRATLVQPTAPILLPAGGQKRAPTRTPGANRGAVQRHKLQQVSSHAKHDFESLRDHYLRDHKDTGSPAHKTAKIVTPSEPEFEEIAQ